VTRASVEGEAIRHYYPSTKFKFLASAGRSIGVRGFGIGEIVVWGNMLWDRGAFPFVRRNGGKVPRTAVYALKSVL